MGSGLDLYGAPRTIVGVIGNEKIHGLIEIGADCGVLAVCASALANGTLLVRTSAATPR